MCVETPFPPYATIHSGRPPPPPPTAPPRPLHTAPTPPPPPHRPADLLVRLQPPDGCVVQDVALELRAPERLARHRNAREQPGEGGADGHGGVPEHAPGRGF